VSSSGADDERGAVALDVVRARVGRREHELVLVDPVGGDEHDATPLELPGDGAGRAEIPPELGEEVADVRGRAVAVVRERFDEDRDALRPVPLVDDDLECRAVRALARALRDRALDVVLGHRVGARLLDRVLERKVRARVGAALLGCDHDRARQLREELAALRVGGALPVLDRRPLAMP
jgi:hypothetical protein